MEAHTPPPFFTGLSVTVSFYEGNRRKIQNRFMTKGLSGRVCNRFILLG